MMGRVPQPLAPGHRPQPGQAELRAAHRLWVGEWPEAIVVLLPGRVPQPQVHRLAVHHHVG